MILTLCSGAGAPGVTTTALGLALHADGPTLLVDVDRDPAQPVLAGWLGGQDPRGRGIVPLVQERGELDDVRRYCLPLTDDGDRSFLPGFPQAANVGLFAPAWPVLARVLTGMSGRGALVVIDAGRTGATGLPPALVAASDVVAVVAGSSLRSLAAARLAIPGMGEARRRALVMVGPDRPYGLTEAAEQFGLEPLGSVPCLPEHAAVLSDGAAPPKRYAQGALVEAYRRLAADVARPVEEVSAA